MVPEFVMPSGRYDEGLRFARNKLHTLNGAWFREQSDSVQAASHSCFVIVLSSIGAPFRRSSERR